MPKWDNSVVRMRKLNQFLQQVLKEIYSQHLVEKMTEYVRCLCSGCMHAKDNKVMHNLCNLHASDQVRFCIYFALDFVDEAAIMEQYGNEVGLAAFEWCNILDPDYRCSNWIGDEEWIGEVTLLVLEKWTSWSPNWSDVERPLPILTDWDGRTWAWQKIRRPPLVLTT